MVKFFLRRLSGSLLTLFAIFTLTFFMMKAVPGGPFDKDRAFPAEVMEEINKKYDLDKPLMVQYLLYMKRIVLEFDLGPSTRFADRSVNELVASGLVHSARIGFGALLCAIIVGIFSGLIASLRHNSLADFSVMTFAMIGVSIPDFVLASILVLIFSLGLGLLPVAMVDNWTGYILPAVTLGLIYAATMARLTRGGMLEILGQDFIRTARAKGLPRQKVIWRHSVKGGLLPVVSYLGPAIAGMAVGSLVVEKKFAIPGLGRHLIDSCINRDYSLTMGCVIIFATLLIFMNLMVDLAYGFLDPRVRYD